jgi:cytochrome c oxidase subunit 1
MASVAIDSHAAGLHDSHAHAHTSGFISTYVFSKDHKIIGLQFLFSTLIWFLIGGL